MNEINFDEFFAELDARGITYEDGPRGEHTSEGEPYITLTVGKTKDPFLERIAPNFIQLVTINDDFLTLKAALVEAMLEYIGTANHVVWLDRPGIEIVISEGGKMRGRASFVVRS